MLVDRYENPLSTKSDKARDAYVDGMDRFLAADGGIASAFEAAIEHDPEMSIAHLGLARLHQIKGDREAAFYALRTAQDYSKSVSPRELSLLNAFTPLIEGKSEEALKKIRAHLIEFPRDAFALQSCTTVFGLIGFSGLPGREAEQLAFTTSLAPHYGDDWWFLSQHAFSQVEVGQVEAARKNIEKSYELNPRSAQMAHIRAHLFYEAGEPAAGFDFLSDWLKGYDKTGLLHGHINWHMALWALDQGKIDLLWDVVDQNISPSGSLGPPLVVLCDTAAILYRASLRGVTVDPQRWRDISNYAARYFPSTGIAFGDVHASLAHAMAGNKEDLNRIITDAKGPAAVVVSQLGSAFRAIAKDAWQDALDLLIQAMSDHARIGGSKAQRDLIEFTMCNVLLKLGKSAEAKWFLEIRRPCLVN